MNENGINLDIKYPQYMHALYTDYDFKYVYYVICGGRGAGKSYAFIEYLIIQSFNNIYTNKYFLCTREMQCSLEDSIFPLLCTVIENWNLSRFFAITQKKIINKITNVTFKFAGLSKSINSIKSNPEIAIVFIEEAATVSQYSFDVLCPTVLRNKNCRILISFNPRYETDCMYKMFIANEAKTNTYVQHTTYRDNIYKMSEKIYEDIEEMRISDPEKYQHIYEGRILLHSEALVFKHERDYVISEEMPTLQNCPSFYGLDFGFVEPTAAVRCVVQDNIIYITHELYKSQLDTVDIMQELVKQMPFNRAVNRIFADCARPETISQIKKQGIMIYAAEKWQGSINDGIAFLKSKKIVIHPRCVHTIYEFSKYSFKKEKRSDIITDIIEDANNHAIDALRYAVSQLIRTNAIDYSKWKM